MANASRSAQMAQLAQARQGDEAAPSTQAKSPQACAEESEAYRAAVRTIHTRLSPREKSVLALFMAGASYGQIARRLHLTPKAVDNALQRVRAKLK